uniref:Uncharacterized protein n=1 Tax=Eutreptiella gymnastica TaxID=73025 RepID=A0A7S4G5G9_9EUGL
MGRGHKANIRRKICELQCCLNVVNVVNVVDSMAGCELLHKSKPCCTPLQSADPQQLQRSMLPTKSTSTELHAHGAQLPRGEENSGILDLWNYHWHTLKHTAGPALKRIEEGHHTWAGMHLS